MRGFSDRFRFLALAVGILLLGAFPAQVLAVGGVGAPACISNLSTIYGYPDNCLTSTSTMQARIAQIQQVIPRQCQEPSLFLSLQGYSMAGDSVVYTSEPVPNTQISTNTLIVNDPNAMEFTTVYRDNVPLGRATSTLNVLGWDTFPSPAGVHTYRVDTYIGNVAPTGSPPSLGGPQTYRGRDVTITSPDASCSGGSSGGSGGGPEVCGDNIDNNGNGQVDENCQSQSITLQAPQASCLGSSAQVALSWTSTLTERPHTLASRDNTGLAHAIEVATIGPIDTGVIPGTVTYTVLRDGQPITVTAATNYADTSVPAGSHTYSISGINSSFSTFQSGNQTVPVSNCGGSSGGSSGQALNVNILGSNLLAPSENRQYCAIVNGFYIPSSGQITLPEDAPCQ